MSSFAYSENNPQLIEKRELGSTLHVRHVKKAVKDEIKNEPIVVYHRPPVEKVNGDLDGIDHDIFGAKNGESNYIGVCEIRNDKSCAEHIQRQTHCGHNANAGKSTSFLPMVYLSNCQ